MKNKITSFLAFAFIIFSVISSPAHAGSFRFGKDTTIVKIQDIDMKGPKGEELYLGYLLEVNYFVLGTGFEDKGYVIGVKGVKEGYYPLPNSRNMKMAQNSGVFPRDLPRYSIDILQYAIGYSLWIFLTVIGLWTFISNSSKKPRRL